MEVPLSDLPSPTLDARLGRAHRIDALTDNALYGAVGVRIAFTGCEGGVSSGPYASLNLGTHVSDDPSAVEENRSRLASALGAEAGALVVPHQVHGDRLVCIDDGAARDLAAVRADIASGCDGIVCTAHGVPVLLNFADCLPLVLVSPTGAFCVVHAGWRGALSGIAGAAARRLAGTDIALEAVPSDKRCALFNAYIGPYIHAEAFETSSDVRDAFARRFGAAVAPDARHVDLGRAVAVDLAQAGVDPARICDADICTFQHSSKYFSYRRSGGVCGRHGAVAYREER